MKNIKILTLAGFLTLGAMSSCNLDRFPHNSISSQESLQSVQDAERWARGFKASLRSAVYGGFMSYADKQSDLIFPQKLYGNNQGDLYNWSIRPENVDISSIWAAYYGRFVNINEFLTRVGSVTLGKNEEGRLAATIADAYFCRAYYYTELAKRFAPLYDAKTAAAELCVPLVLTYDVSLRPPRATQEAVYKQILADLAKAKEEYAKTGDANVMTGTPGSHVITADAVAALEARVYLQMRDYAKALEVSKALIATGRYRLVAPTANSFVNMWANDSSSEDILKMFVNKDDDKDAPVGVGGYFSAFQVGEKPNVKRVTNPMWLPTQGIIDLFEAKDLRRGVYFDDTEDVYVANTVFEKGTLTVISKFKGNPALAANTSDPLWGIKPDGRHYPRVFRITEAYLIAAEAAYQTGNVADAQKYLNDVRKSRGLDPVAAAGDQLFTEIKNERTREFAFEGFRLWDLKRWEMPMERMALQIVRDGQGGNIEISAQDIGDNYRGNNMIKASDHRFTWPIPNRDIRSNKNIAGQQNKGY